ncbi:hypothetical protein, partial [Pedobacter sp.]|uniref:sugar phosphate isomerase/epimerase family protein n=1 Tax=Pedobacter sp. TaxID=1411316 RepID=UPI002D088B3C
KRKWAYHRETFGKTNPLFRVQIKILSPLWGYENLPIHLFLDRVKDAGYDGLDTWIPENYDDKKKLFDYVQHYGMTLVVHQYRAQGSTFKAFKASFLKNLHECAEPDPVLINSHTGRDWFSLKQQLELIDVAQDFSEKTGITVVHETHRGRLGFAPQLANELFERREDYKITADLSHWTCVTESMLENFEQIVEQAIRRTRHVHARIGHENGPQVPDPRAPEWSYALDIFLGWWDRIVALNLQLGHAQLTFTTEFGPPPYMPTIPFVNTPVADQFEINCYIKNLLKDRYAFLPDQV